MSSDIEKLYLDVKNQFRQDSNLRVVEAVFANLVAREGFDYKDAYIEAFKPNTENIDSVYQMASRMANKPKVKAEIDRIRVQISEEEMSKDQRLKIVYNGGELRDRIYIELFAMAMSPDIAPNLKFKILSKLGEAKHVDAWVGSNAVVADQARRATGFDLSSASSAAEARGLLIDQLKKAIAERTKDVTIDIGEKNDAIDDELPKPVE